MSNSLRKIQKNAENFMIKKYFEEMTPQQYQEGIQNAIKTTEARLLERYNKELHRMGKEYNTAIQEGMLLAMDTLAVEMIYELGNILGCYEKEPEALDQKIKIIQNIYETAMNSISDYDSNKYKDDKQAQKEFKRKQDVIKKMFGMEIN